MGWGNQKPWLGKRVNWADPMTKNFGGCWIYNEQAGTFSENLATLGTVNNGLNGGANYWGGLPGGSTGFVSPGRGEGNGLHGFNCGTVNSTSLMSGVPRNELSIAVGCTYVGAPANTHVVVEKADGDLGSNGWSVYIGAQLDSFQLYMNGGANSFQKNGSLTVGNYYDALITARLGASGRHMYLGGVDIGATTGGVVSFQTDTTNLAIADYADNYGFDRKFIGFIKYVYIWGRILNPLEAARLASDNYCFMEDPFPLNFTSSAGFALPIMGTGDIHSTIFGGQVIR